ncbi:MAG: lipid-A-disaccharide synthase [Alphaproteobacteria bacterium]|nr:lipid-A-disaccharide synthase [Alphaproteobacteria bacterium]
MPNKKTIFIIAGEVSGDVLGANIMRELPEYNFVGVGGQNMCGAGLQSIFPMSDLAVMGIIEVLSHARTLKHRIRETVQKIIDEKPDLVLTIDSPGFARSVISGLKNSRVGRDLIRDGLRFYHVVAPQVWAWRPGRAKKYSEIFDKLYAFFDFEVPYFTRHGLDTIAVGHPVSDNIMGKYVARNVRGKKIVALMPGSRKTEVKKLMPVFREFVDLVGDKYKFIIPTVETTDALVRAAVADWTIRPEIISAQDRYGLYEKTFVAVAASGTVSAELAMVHVPAIIVYRMNWLTTIIGKILVNVKWVSLVNILLNRSVYPELLGSGATAKNILREFNRIADDEHVREEMIAELKSADKLWRPDSESVGARIAADIKKSI